MLNAVAAHIRDPSIDDEHSFYVADLGHVRRMHGKWASLFPDVQPYYGSHARAAVGPLPNLLSHGPPRAARARPPPHAAIKSNPNEAILATLERAGAGFDCASALELDTVAAQLPDSAAARRERILFANPCKPASHIRHARRLGVDRMTFDSVDELAKIAAEYPDARLILRIHADDTHARCRLGAKFGAPMDDVPHLVHAARALGLDLHGVSFHVGSGATDPAAFADALIRARRAVDICEEHGFAPRAIDIGGGFAGGTAPTAAAAAAAEAGGRDGDAAPTQADGAALADVAAGVNPLLRSLFPPSQGFHYLSEPGRYFSEGAFTLATPIVGRRALGRGGDAEPNQPPQVLLYITDGVYGAFNCTLFDHASVTPHVVPAEATATASRSAGRHASWLWPERHGPELAHLGHAPSASFASSARPVGHGDAGARQVLATVYGPTCDGLDCVVRNAPLPDLAIGRWLYWPNMGAYTDAAASTFNGFPRANIVYLPDHDAATDRHDAPAAGSDLPLNDGNRAA